jgi:hypothetical protein
MLALLKIGYLTICGKMNDLFHQWWEIYFFPGPITFLIERKNILEEKANPNRNFIWQVLSHCSRFTAQICIAFAYFPPENDLLPKAPSVTRFFS